MLRAGHGLILVVVGLLALGVVMVTSAGLTVGTDAAHPAVRDVLLGRSACIAVLAVAMLLAASRLPVLEIPRMRGLASPVPWITLAVAALLVAVHIPGIGREVNGARRWVDVGPIGFQPSELAKWGLIVVLAWHAARRAEAMPSC